MKDLIAKLEAAPEGNRELDENLAFQIKWRPQTQASKASFAEHEAKHNYATAWIAHASFRWRWPIPNFTTSLDAKVPGENIVAVNYSPYGNRWFAVHKETTERIEGKGRTEILARRIAGLKGMDSQRTDAVDEREE